MFWQSLINAQRASVTDTFFQYRTTEHLYHQSINESINKTCITRIYSKADLQHVKKEFLWERGKLKCNTYDTLSPSINRSYIVDNK